MANEQNLIPWNERTENEQREYARQGGKKSGEVRRKRKEMKEQLNLLLSLPLNIKDNQGNEIKEILKGLGLEDEEIDNQMAMIISLWKTAIKDGKNQVSAFQAIRDTLGDKSSEKEKLKLEKERLELEKKKIELELVKLEMQANKEDSTKEDNNVNDNSFIKALNDTAKEVWEDEDTDE